MGVGTPGVKRPHGIHVPPPRRLPTGGVEPFFRTLPENFARDPHSPDDNLIRFRVV